MPASPERPLVAVLDVNETLTDMSPLSARLERVGAPGHLLAPWFAGVLRDGIALAAAGAFAPFAELAAAGLRGLLSAQPGLDRTPEEAAEFVLGGLVELPLHPDIRPGISALRDAGLRVIALTNGGGRTARQVLTRGGVAELLEDVLSVEEPRRWKPAPESYLYAARRCDVAPGRMMLIAVHPWDIDGARRAGLRAAWINRTGAPYPEPLLGPELEAESLPDLAAALASAGLS